MEYEIIITVVIGLFIWLGLSGLFSYISLRISAIQTTKTNMLLMLSGLIFFMSLIVVLLVMIMTGRIAHDAANLQYLLLEIFTVPILFSLLTSLVGLIYLKGTALGRKK